MRVIDSFNEYQKRARETAIYPDAGKNFIYPTLGLCGETGEVAEKIKKIMRDFNGHVSSEKRDELAKELGDVLWYLSNLAYELEIPLTEIASLNIEKLKSRKDRNQLHGDGDNR